MLLFCDCGPKEENPQPSGEKTMHVQHQPVFPA